MSNRNSRKKTETKEKDVEEDVGEMTTKELKSFTIHYSLSNVVRIL